jgi:hypothetical protein
MYFCHCDLEVAFQEREFKAIAHLLTTEYLSLEFYTRLLADWVTQSITKLAEAEAKLLLATCEQQKRLIRHYFSCGQASQSNWIALA